MSIIDFIKKENARDPLTDEELAQLMSVSRVAVTKLRKSNHIADSRKRKKDKMIVDLTKLLKEHAHVSDRRLTELINEKGYNTTRYLVTQLKKEIYRQNPDLCKKSASAVKSSSEEKNVFSEVIGYDGSLKFAVEQAKAALLYPPKGLHTILVGNSGVGKSFMAEKMYDFAVTTDNFDAHAPFMSFNCADYADNPQLLLGQLFGYTKGSFTGASADKKGIVELCNGGILFLDEIHRLPEEGQEILFQLLDKGQYRRMGETETTRKSHIMLIGATTEDPEHSLLLTFRRRIPMLIDIQSYNERPVHERAKLVETFFKQEGNRLKRNLVINKDVFKIFVSYRYPGNIGQLKNIVKVCCAKALLQAMTYDSDRVRVTFQHMPEQIRKDILNGNLIEETDPSTATDLVINYDGQGNPSSNIGSSEEDIYQYIENMHTSLKYEGYDETQVVNLLGHLVDKKLKDIARISTEKRESVNNETLENIVGKEFLQMAEHFYEQARKKIPLLQRSVVYPLATHMKSAHERIMANKGLVYPNLSNVRKAHEKEFFVAKELLRALERKLKLKIPEDEIGFCTLYLWHFQVSNKNQSGHVGIIILSHGHVAGGMAAVINELLGVRHAVGVEMALTDSPSFMLEKTIVAVKRADQGRGCIILADMGSLLSFGPMITSRTGIPVKIIGRVDTLMAMECVRKSLIPEYTMDDIVMDLDQQRVVQPVQSQSFGLPAELKKPVVLTLCITGKGSALKIKDYLQNSYASAFRKIEIIPVGLASHESIEEIIGKYQQTKNIISVVGTIDPKMPGLPYIFFEDLLHESGKTKLERILKGILKKENHLNDVIDSRFVQIDEDSMNKESVLDQMVAVLLKNQRVTEKFSLSIYKRETFGDTLLKGGIAIPHGNSAFVIKPTIMVTKLSHGILWSANQKADLVFMLALDQDSKTYFEQLYPIISDPEEMNQARQMRTQEGLLRLILGR